MITYSSTRSASATCALGTGSNSETVTATSPIAAADASDKASEAAAVRAVRELECVVTPETPLTVSSVQKTAVRHCFQCGDTVTGTLDQIVTVPAGTFVAEYAPGGQIAAQAAVDAAAQTRADRLAADLTPCPPRYFGRDIVISGWCGYPEGVVGYPVSGRYDSATRTACSMVSQAAANQAALEEAGAAYAASASTCVPTYGNELQTYTAVCPKPGEPGKVVGNPVTVVVPANTYTSTGSVSPANAEALAAAQAAAEAQLVCYGYANESQVPVVKTCSEVFGPFWGPMPGATQPSVESFRVPAGAYYSDVSQAAANAAALAAAQAAYDSSLQCEFQGSGEGDDPFAP